MSIFVIYFMPDKLRWFSKDQRNCLIDYTIAMVDVAHGLKCISYLRRFGSLFYFSSSYECSYPYRVIYIFFILRLGAITGDQTLYFWILHSITLPTISGPPGPPVRTQPLPIMLTWNIQQIRKCQQSVTLLAHSLCCYRVVLNWRLFARRKLTIRVFEILQVTLYTTDVSSLRAFTAYL